MTTSELVVAARMCVLSGSCESCPFSDSGEYGGCADALLMMLADTIEDDNITVNQYGKNCVNITNLGTLKL